MKSIEALEDAKRALELCEATESKVDFRIYITAAITIIRSIGHILNASDSKIDKTHQIAISKILASTNTNITPNDIFHKFIKPERDNILKEYEFNYSAHDHQIIFDNKIHEINWSLYVPIVNDFYQGEDILNIIKKSIEWWECNLKLILNEVNSNANI